MVYFLRNVFCRYLIRAGYTGARSFAFLLGGFFSWLFVLQPTNAIAFTTPNWSNAVTDVSNSDFDTGTLTFPAQFASQISINDPGAGYWHDHSAGASNTIEVLLNGVWTLVFTGPVSNGTDINLSTIPTVGFTGGQVSGVRLSCTARIRQCYHGVSGAMSFELIGGNVAGNLRAAGKSAAAAFGRASNANQTYMVQT